METNERNKIIIFDTTLRDGEQASGFHMVPEDKFKFALKLAELDVDVIEAGFAISSPGDAKAIYNIAKQMNYKTAPVICSLARTKDEDIEAAAKAIGPAYNPRIHTFIATSNIHINKKLRKTKQWVIDKAANSVMKAKGYVDDVEFSCEDFGRTDKDYIVDVVYEAIIAGAKTINLPDTVGWLLPNESYEKINYVIQKVNEKGYKAIFSVHNHNDLGMATANTLMAIIAGASQVHVTVNGIGERAGNAALEEVVAGIYQKELGICRVKRNLIGPASKLLSEITGVYPQPNKAIVGKNAFAHEAGIHQDGQIKDVSNYEIMDPADYGVQSILTFGPRSGSNALRAKYQSLGIKLSDEEFEKTAQTFTSIADYVTEIDDADIVRSVNKGEDVPQFYSLVAYHPIVDGHFGAVVKLKIDDRIETVYAEGNGQIDSASKAVMSIVGKNYELTDYDTISEGKGSDAIGVSRVTVRNNSWTVIGRGKSTDVITSSITSIIDGCNRMKYLENYFNQKL